jgi:hypothetical protein
MASDTDVEPLASRTVRKYFCYFKPPRLLRQPQKINLGTQYVWV